MKDVPRNHASVGFISSADSKGSSKLCIAGGGWNL